MALSVYPFDEQCVPPINTASLAYHPSSGAYFEGQSNLATSLYSLDGVISMGDQITVPAQCGGGMDIVFLVDYTGSMGNAIDGVKLGLSNILSTIDTESLGNYRVGFCLFDEYSGNLSTPTNYGDNSAYVSLPQAQRVVINSEYNHTQFITCMAPLGNVGDSSFFQTQLNKINNTMPLGAGDSPAEPGGLGINEIISNQIAGAFRSDATKVIVLITDNMPGGYDDTNNSVDATYLHNLRGLADSLDIQIMIQSTQSSDVSINYTTLTNTTPAGRYDQVSFDSEGDWINSGLISGIQSLCDNSFTPTCVDAPAGWYHKPNTFQAWYYDGTTVNNVYNFTPQYGITSSYYREPHLIGTDEDNKSITWIVDTQYVSNGTTLYWNMNTGDTDASDFIENEQNGSFTINNNTGQFSLTTKNDFKTEGHEQIVMTIRTGSVNGIIVATEYILVDDSSTPLPTATSVPQPTPTRVPLPTPAPTLSPTATPVPVPQPTATSYSSGSGSGSGVTPTATPFATIAPPPAPTPTPIPSYKHVVECVSGDCLQGTGRVASSSTAYSLGDVVSLNNVNGCWEVLSITNATAASSITGICTPSPTQAPSYYVYKMDPCDGVSSYVNARSNSPITIGGVYRLTGSGYADQAYTAIQSLGAVSFDTYIGLADECGSEEPIGFR